MTEKERKAYNDLKRKVVREAKKANDRLERLEKKGYTNTPAYLAWKKSDAKKFSASHKKTYNDIMGNDIVKFTLGFIKVVITIFIILIILY